MSATVHRIHPDGPGIVELRGRQMRALAHDLGFEAMAALAGEQHVKWIALDQFRPIDR